MSQGGGTLTTSAEAELARARGHIAALEQLLAVHEQISLEQATKLEQALRGRDELLSRERAARDLLAGSEARLRLAIEAGQMGTWEWDIENGRVLWSAEEERLYGLEPGSFSGTLEEYRAHIHPDDRDSSLKQVQDALARHAPTHHILHRILHPSGETRWLDSHARFIYAEDGRPLRLVGVSTDVTERLEIQRARDRALAQAKAERERLNSVFMQAPAAITVLEGPDHVFTVINPLYDRLVGGRDLLGKTIRTAMPELEGQGFYELLDRVYATGEPFSASEVLVKLASQHDKDAIEELYVDFVYQPMKDADDAPFGILVHAVNSTERVRARQLIEQKAEELQRLTAELERSNRELDQFAYVASHDLKAPLRGIANLTEWIEEDLGDRVTGDSREHMQLLKGRVHRMEGLIEGILAYSRAGRMREKPETVDVGRLLGESIELLAPPAETMIVVAPGMPVLQTERIPLQQVFLNLIGNAIKYAGSGPRIDVGVKYRTGCYEFSVADNGPGIPPQFHEKVWQIFQTLAPRDKVEGTGIGLSVVRKIVEARGGRTWLESEPGKGTTFYFTWPEHPRMT